MSNTTTHTTGIGNIQFMAAARPVVNKFAKGKKEYSIRIELNTNDECLDHIRGINSKKVDTDKNKELASTGKAVLNFTSDYAPKVKLADGTLLTTEQVPFFNSKVDEGTAVVTYKVIDFGDNKIIRLSEIQIMSLNLAPREEKQGETTYSDEEVAAKLKALSN